MSHILFVMVDDFLLDIEGYRPKNSFVSSHFLACNKMLQLVEDIALKDKLVRDANKNISSVSNKQRSAYIRYYDNAMKILSGNIGYDPYLMAQDYYYRLIIGDKIDRDPIYRLRKRKKEGSLTKYFNNSLCFEYQDQLTAIYKEEMTDAPNYNKSLVACLSRLKLKNLCDIVYLTALEKDRIQQYMDKREIGLGIPVERVYLNNNWMIDKESLSYVAGKYGNQNSHLIFASKENKKYINTAKSLGMAIVCVGDDMNRYVSDLGFHIVNNEDVELVIKEELLEYDSIGVKQRLKKINNRVINPYQGELKLF